MTPRLATGDSVDSSDAPVIRSRLNQLELLTGIRMMIRILSYEDHLIDSSDAPVIRYVPDHLELLSEHCHIVILKIILFAKSDPRQTLTKFTTISSSLLLFVLATLKKDIFTRPLPQKGSSLQEEILSVCLWICLSVITFSFFEYSMI